MLSLPVCRRRVRLLLGPVLVWLCPVPLGHAAEPCRVADVPLADVTRAVERLAAPRVRVPPAVPSRWTALLPGKMAATWRDGSFAGTGVYWATAGETQRGSWGTDRSVVLRAEWDLRPLWAPVSLPAGPTADVVAHAGHVEEVARRAAAQWLALRRAQQKAALATTGDAACAEAYAESEAAWLVLAAFVASAR